MKIKILLMNKDPFILNMYKIKLQLKGVEVESFTDVGGDIVQRVLDVKPDLIALDIVIQDENGYRDGYDRGLSAAAKLKADSRTKDIPLVFLTNQGQLKDIEDAKKVGSSGYIIMATTKPEEVTNCLISFCKTGKF